MEFRSIDGSGNHLTDTSRNSAGEGLGRLAPARFVDGIAEMVGGPNPRTISNIVVGEGDAAQPNALGLSGMIYAWGQFIDHDFVRTRSDGVTAIPVTIPDGDPVFQPGTMIAVTRIQVAPGTGAGTALPGAPVNRSTGWLDGSVVYGSDPITAAALRAPDGKMLTSGGDNLPIMGGQFLAGDPRASENPSLTSLQTLFLREHNFQVERLAAADPSLTPDQLYEMARAIVGAQIAHITYEEFLPKLLGGALPAWAGYDPNADATLSLEFTTAAWRWGHSTVSPETFRRGETGVIEPDGQFELRDAFFLPPAEFLEGDGAAGFLRHLGADRAQAMDARIVEDLRSFLFDPPAVSDLAAFNIQRGRDVGQPTFNDMREWLGLPRYTSFADITDDAATVAALEAAYGTVDAIELWTGGLAEQGQPGVFLGETFAAMTRLQFLALRDGDRLWWEGQGFDPATLQMIRETSLSDLVLRHTDTVHLQGDMFVYYERRAADARPETPDERQLVIGTADGQVLRGGALDDLLYGRDGDQVLRGWAGNDGLYGGAGRDLLDGGDGADRLDGGTEADRLLGRDGDDVLDGGDGDDLLNAHAGDDMLQGGNGNDTLLGREGDDSLDGGAGDDRLVGDAGNDTLTGGAGSDTLLGGAGADVFRFANLGDSPPTARDVIRDFQAGEDRISLLAGDPVAASLASDPFQWLDSAAFTATGASEVRWQRQGSGVRLEADGNGDGTADFAVFVVGATRIDASDLIF